MYIPDSVLECLLALVKVESRGCHAPHPNTPLYGRAAFFNVGLPDGSWNTKVTFPIKSMSPKEDTLKRGLRAELKRRIEAIQLIVDLDHYSQVSIREIDPYGVKFLLKLVDKQYVDLMARKLWPEQVKRQA